jgi:hypothetical protein
MDLGRISVALSAVVFGRFGLAFLFWPVQMAAFVNIPLPSSAAIIDFRAVQGGLEVGLAIFFLICLCNAAWVRVGLVAQVATLSGLTLARVLGLLLDGTPQPIIYWLQAAEVSGVILRSIALRATPK